MHRELLDRLRRLHDRLRERRVRVDHVRDAVDAEPDLDRERDLVDEIASRQTYRVSFPQQAIKGSYQYSIGPNITGVNGLLLDQDGDDIGGEPVEDVYEGEITVFGGQQESFR